MKEEVFVDGVGGLGEYLSKLGVVVPSYVAGTQYLLGRLYIDARDVTHDINTGIEWLTKASENGNWEASYTLGYLYAKGSFGIKRDTEKAKRLLEPLKNNVDKSQSEKLRFAISLCR